MTSELYNINNISFSYILKNILILPGKKFTKFDCIHNVFLAILKISKNCTTKGGAIVNSEEIQKMENKNSKKIKMRLNVNINQLLESLLVNKLLNIKFTIFKNSNFVSFFLIVL